MNFPFPLPLINFLIAFPIISLIKVFWLFLFASINPKYPYFPQVYIILEALLWLKGLLAQVHPLPSKSKSYLKSLNFKYPFPLISIFFYNLHFEGILFPILFNAFRFFHSLFFSVLTLGIKHHNLTLTQRVFVPTIIEFASYNP